MGLLYLVPLRGSTGGGVQVTKPLQGQIYQRDTATETGVVNITGAYAGGSVVAIQARLVSITGGATTPWTAMTLSNPNFSGSITASTGWYSLSVKALDTFGNTISSATVSTCGVGEVFVICGQSLACNEVNSLSTVSDPRLQMATVQQDWALGSDSQYNDSPFGGTQGSVWPIFSNDLLAALSHPCPIGLMQAAVGGSSSDQWLPANAANYYNDYLKPSVQYFPANGFRAVLWLQGEADALAGVSTATYTSNLQSIIGQSRTDAGWTCPWIIGDPETYRSGVTAPNQALIAAAQAALVAGAVSNCYGVDMDNNIPLMDRYDGTHPNLAGAVIIGGLWSSAVISNFGL